MYSNDRNMADCLEPGGRSAGLGTVAVMGSTSCGDVPQVTLGATSEAVKFIKIIMTFCFFFLEKGV
jgi:hypothetical protein